MNNCITFILESEKGLIIPINQKDLFISAEIKKNFKIEDFDFENWEDILDYCYYQGYDNYIIISKGKRILEIVKTLNNNSFYTKFWAFSINQESRNIEKNPKFDNIGVLELFLRQNIEKFRNKLEYPKTLEQENLLQGAYAFLTGNYPPNIPENSLKHIYIDQTSDLNLITVSLFIKSNINSAIVISKSVDKQIPIPFIQLNHSYYSIENFTFIEKEKLVTYIMNFIDSGEVQSLNAGGIIDYSTLVEKKGLKRIFIKNSSIYEDFSMKKMLLSNTKDLNIEELINIKSLKQREYTVDINQVNIYYLVLNLGEALNMNGEFIAITPFNKSLIAPVKNIEWNIIGIMNSTKSYIYVRTTNKFYTTSKRFLVILEFYLKNQMNSYLLKEIVSSKEIVNFKNTLNKLKI